MKTDRLLVVFAHNNEPLPVQFQTYPTPQSKPLAQLSTRLRQKWKSQRMAFFLLHHIFEQHGVDHRLLNSLLRTSTGRPYVAHPEIDFNISHSGDWVAVIFSKSPSKQRVGIDIEHPQKTRHYSGLLSYYADQTEIEQINDANTLPELLGIEARFYLSWCLREAVLKSQGVGIVKLAEVQHSLKTKSIRSSHCPTGKLYFYSQLPFYLAYFFEQGQSMLSSPTLSQWKNGTLIQCEALQPIIYQVN